MDDKVIFDRIRNSSKINFTCRIYIKNGLSPVKKPLVIQSLKLAVIIRITEIVKNIKINYQKIFSWQRKI